MKIAIFTEAYLPYINGVVTHIRLLREGLEALGHEVMIVTADPHVKRNTLTDGVLRCPAAAIKKIYGYGIASPLSATRLNLITAFSPDIIHIHNEFGIGFFGVSAAGLLRVPLVYTLHTMYDDYLHYIAPHGMTKILNMAVTRYLKLILANTTAVIGPSAKVEEFFRRHRISKPVHIIRNCADIRAFSPERRDPQQVAAFREKYGIPANAKLLMHISRVAAEKSIDVMINYFVKRFSGDAEYYMVIVGDGPARAQLEEQVRLWEMQKRIIFTGALPNTEIPNICHASDLFVSCSLSEIYSISMLEALASGMPAVVRRDEINKGQVIHGQNGFIFDDDTGFERYVREYFAMPQPEQQALREAVRASVAGYGSEQLASEVVAVYEEAKETYRTRKNRGKKQG